MGRLLKYLFLIALMAFLGLVAYAVLDDLPPPTKEVVVELPAPGGGS